MTKFAGKTMTYDGRGRLQSCGGMSYTYDNYGNRTAKGGTSYTWTKGRLLSGMGSASYTCDYNGTENTSSTFIGNINAIRYRGYYFDDETGFYYLQSRYYDPSIRRFISADQYELLGKLSEVPGQLNLYAYCGNNPVSYIQRSGTFEDSITDSSSSGMSGSSMYNLVLANGSFRNGLFFGKGTVIGLYAGGHVRAQISLKKETIKLGIAGKFSLLNVTAQIGFGTNDLNLSLKTVGDIGTVTGMAGIFIDPQNNIYFVGVEAKATALSGRIGGQLDILGVQIEVGFSGELGSIGGRLGVGYKKDGIYFGAGFAVFIGWDFYIRIKIGELFE